MKKRLLKRYFPIIALMILLPWPMAYGYEVVGASTAQESIQITAAEASAQPTWTAFGKAIGSVTAGDLFYIDATANTADINATLYLTNAPELIHHYRYLTLKIGLYRQVADADWDKVTEYNGMPVPDTFITMNNGQVSVTLSGCASYKLTIDGGSFYSYGAEAGDGNASPEFFLEIAK